MPRLLRDPLLHFVLLGAAIFVLYAAVEDDPQTDSRRIVVTEEEIAGLWQAMAMLSGQPPTEAAVYELVEPRIREEILYREALALGLDEGDSQIRQRLVEKMSFLTEDLLPAEEPSESELAAFLDSHREAFLEPVRLSFEQIYFSPGRHGEQVVSAAEAALAQLAVPDAPADLGDPSTVADAFEAATADEVRSELGEEFATAVFGLEDDGRWHGPIRSLFGAHLVRISARRESRMPTLSEIRNDVLAAFNAERRRQANEAAYQELRGRYDIVIEIPDIVRDQWQTD